MSNSIQLFNGLNGTVATRTELENIIEVAKQEEQTHVATKLENLLSENEDAKFDISLVGNALEIVPQSMLNGLHHEEFTSEEDTGLNKAVTSSDIYQMITDKMLEMIKEASGKGYVKKWKGNVYGTGYTIPFNFDSKKRYRGVNVFLLTGFEPLENPFFMTFKQIEANKGKLKKGSKGSPVIYFTNLYKITDKKRDIDFGTYDFNKAKEYAAKNGFKESDIYTLPILKYYNVFNGKDIENIDFDLENFKIGYIEKELPTTERLPIADAIVENYPAPAPPIKHGGNDAFYAIGGKGYIQMPHMADFETAQDYYRTLLHELSHSTGDFIRLNRKIANKFGTKDYAFEELVAEWGATFLSAEAGIIFHTNNNHAEYIKNWNNVLVHLKDDNKFIMKACTLAQKLTDYILQFDESGTPLYLKNLKVNDTKIEVEKKEKTIIIPKEILKNKIVFFNVSEPFDKKYNEVKKVNARGLKIANENKLVLEDPTGLIFTKSFRLGFSSKNIIEKLSKYFAKIKVAKNDEIPVAKVEKPVAKPTTKSVGVATTKKTRGAKVEENAIKNNSVLDFPISKILTDEKRFQNRTELNQNTINQIVKNYNPAKFDPVIVWQETKTKKVFVLAGHHRFEAVKKLKHKTVQVKFLTGSEAEAIHYAKVESNANRTAETDFERAKIYRSMRETGVSKKEILDQAKEIEGKNAIAIINLSYLKENGVTIQALQQLDKADKQNKSTIEKIADWIGEALRTYSKLEYSHEKEMFDFLNDFEQSKRIKSKQEFIQKITAIAGGFDFESTDSLNLKRLKYKSQGENVYESEFKELQSKIDAILDKKTELKEKMINLINSGKNQSEYSSQLETFENLTVKANEDIKFYQSKLLELTRNKSKYTAAGNNQAALFGVKEKPVATEPKKHSKIQKIALAGNEKESEFFDVAGEVGKFLQQVEKKPVESVVITLDGQQGAGKTTTLYKFMDSFASTGNDCLFLSLEEHPSSSLAKEKVVKYLSKAAQDKTDSVGEVESIEELYEMIAPYDIIFIDSWQKLQRMVGAIRLDEDLRKKFNGKVFVVIFQQTTTGRTKGGAEVVFDGDIIIKMVKENSFADNYAYFDKNRYTKIAIEDIRYNIANGTVYNPNATEEPASELQPVQEVEFSFLVE